MGEKLRSVPAWPPRGSHHPMAARAMRRLWRGFWSGGSAPEVTAAGRALRPSKSCGRARGGVGGEIRCRQARRWLTGAGVGGCPVGAGKMVEGVGVWCREEGGGGFWVWRG